MCTPVPSTNQSISVCFVAIHYYHHHHTRVGSRRRTGWCNQVPAPHRAIVVVVAVGGPAAAAAGPWRGGRVPGLQRARARRRQRPTATALSGCEQLPSTIRHPNPLRRPSAARLLPYLQQHPQCYPRLQPTELVSFAQLHPPLRLQSTPPPFGINPPCEPLVERVCHA